MILYIFYILYFIDPLTYASMSLYLGSLPGKVITGIITDFGNFPKTDMVNGAYSKEMWQRFANFVYYKYLTEIYNDEKVRVYLTVRALLDKINLDKLAEIKKTANLISISLNDDMDDTIKELKKKLFDFVFSPDISLRVYNNRLELLKNCSLFSDVSCVYSPIKCDVKILNIYVKKCLKDVHIKVFSK